MPIRLELFSFDRSLNSQTYEQGQALPKGHSTARMAGAFAACLEAKNLLLTHFRHISNMFRISHVVVTFFFSARYMPRSKDEGADMNRMEQEVS